ncbi:MAG: PEGA domain-containing protein [Fibrobacterales bacterium]
MKLFTILTTLLLTLGTLFAEEMTFPERGSEGTIIITSDPRGSVVYLDAEELGKTPVEMPFRSGRFDLVIMDQEIELVNTRFSVWPDSINTYNATTKIPIGKIELKTKPGKCKVWLDGERAGSTQGGTLTMHNLDAGTHLVRIKCGSKSKEELIEVTGEETIKVTMNVYKK